MENNLEERRRTSGVKPMGINFGVTRKGEYYKDNIVDVRFHEIKPNESIEIITSKTHSSILCFGKGNGKLKSYKCFSGIVVQIPNDTSNILKAANEGLDFFEIKFKSNQLYRNIKYFNRVPLHPFEEEQIIVPKGTPLPFEGKINLAEVIVPPRVTTSEHNLGVNECYLILGDNADMYINDNLYTVGLGDIVHIPSGDWQYIDNKSEVPLRFYSLCSPPFTAETYGRGTKKRKVPIGFDLQLWWNDNKKNIL